MVTMLSLFSFFQVLRFEVFVQKLVCSLSVNEGRYEKSLFRGFRLLVQESCLSVSCLRVLEFTIELSGKLCNLV